MALAKLLFIDAGNELPAGLPLLTAAEWTRTHES